LPAHPIGGPALKYWPADYWITLGTSGVLTAGTAALLVLWALELGCGKAQAALIGLAYGLATPAYVYATLAYGHQATAAALFGAFFLLRNHGGPHQSIRSFLAGFLAAGAAVIELQVAPLSAILGVYLFARWLRGDRGGDALALFVVGAAIPTFVMLLYNQLAFGSPWDMGYFHHDTQDFARVHHAGNPLGLTVPPDFWKKLVSLVWGRYRGIAFYAPILILAIPGWVVLLARRSSAVAVVSLLAVTSMLLVNLFYPEWTGGWSTGPRLLLPAIPFAMLPVAALLATGSPWRRIATVAAMILAVAGGIEMLLYQGADGRIPHFISDPFLGAVWPLWTGQALPAWRENERFCPNLVALVAPGWIGRLSPSWQWAQFLPLIMAQLLATAGVCQFATQTGVGPDHPGRRRAERASDLGIDQEQQDRGGDQKPENPEAEPDRVPPDLRPGFVPRRRIDDADRGDQR
jgi:hypothetical protein